MAGCVGLFKDSQHQPGAYTVTGGTLCRFSLPNNKSSSQVGVSVHVCVGGGAGWGHLGFGVCVCVRLCL